MINLLPPDRLANLRIARSNTILRRYIQLALIGSVVLVAAVVLAYYFLNTQQVNTRHTAEANQQKIAQLEPVQKQAEELSATVNTIAGLFSRNIKFSDMLTQIGGVMPPGSVLTGLQFSIEDLDSPLAISAQVDTEQKAAILRNNLAGSSLFSKAEIQTIAHINNDVSVSDSTTPSPSKTPTTSVTTNKSPYNYTTVINAYLKDVSETKK